MKKNPPNEEGFVVRYSNGLRLKLKYAEYVRLHKLLTGFSVKDVWNQLRLGKPVADLLTDVPDEFFDWVRAWEKKLTKAYDEINEDVENTFLFLQHQAIMGSRVEFAKYVTKNYNPISAELFRKLDKRLYGDIIWKKIRPRGAKVFKLDEV